MHKEASKFLRRTRLNVAFLLGTCLALNPTFAAKPKFGPENHPLATPLYESNEYFRNASNKAPQFWALISHYIPQTFGASCSVASVAMTVNAARAQMKLSADDQIISELSLLDQVEAEHWKARTTGKLGYLGSYGVGLDRLVAVTTEAFKKNGFPDVQVQAVHVNDRSKQTQDKIIGFLKDFESRSDSFLLANFDQKEFTNDQNAGHIAPVGAYDSKNQKVLILDPDRQYFMPYWISLDTFTAGMNTLDKTEKGFRGLVLVHTGKPSVK